MRALPLLLLLSLCGCRLFLGGDQIPCADDQDCPPSLDCVSDSCAVRSAPLPPVVDAGDRDPPDAGIEPIVDAGPPSAEDGGATPPADAGQPADAGALIDAGVDAGEPFDAGPIDPCDAWPELGLLSRVKVELTSDTSSAIPVGYPLRLDLSAVLGRSGGDEPDDFRLYHCDAELLSEAPLRPETGAGPDRWFTRAARAISPGALDDDYWLYFNGTASGARLETVPGARHLEGRREGLVFLDEEDIVVSLTLDPLVGTERWLVVATWSQVGSPPRVVLDAGSTTFNFGARMGVRQSSLDPSSGGFMVDAPDGASAATLTLSGTGGITDLIFFAALLPGGATTTAANQNGSDVTIDFVDTLGPGALLFSGRIDWDNDVIPGLVNPRVVAALQTGGETRARIDYMDGDTGLDQPLWWAGALPELDASLSFSNLNSAQNGHRIFYRAIYIPAAGAFDLEATALGSQVSSNGSGTLSPVGTELSVAGSTVLRDQLLFASTTLGRSVTSAAARAEAQIQLDGNAHRQDITSTDVETVADRSVAWAAPFTTAQAMSLSVASRMVAGSGNANVRTPSLMALRYFEVVTTSGATEPRPE